VTVDPIATEPPALLDAMLAMIRRKGCDYRTGNHHGVTIVSEGER
jgi:hypothetical protein